jgi:hypothetical protein
MMVELPKPDRLNDGGPSDLARKPTDWESGHPTLTSDFRWGFRMLLAEPGVRLSIRTGLSLDVYA